MPEVAPPDEQRAEGSQPTHYHGKGLDKIFPLSRVIPRSNVVIQYPPRNVEEDGDHNHDGYAKDGLLTCEASILAFEGFHTTIIMLSILLGFTESYRLLCRAVALIHWVAADQPCRQLGEWRLEATG